MSLKNNGKNGESFRIRYLIEKGNDSSRNDES